MASTEYYYTRKSGQIPAFGDWENTNDLPITQYFECARQAGLSSCNRECCSNNASYVVNSYHNNNADYLYGFGFSEYQNKTAVVSQRKTRTGINKSCSNIREQRKQIKVRDLMDHHHHHQKHYSNVMKSNDVITSSQQQQQKINVKPVDEDLYKIPSQHLENPKRKKMLGFFSRCMAPPCAA